MTSDDAARSYGRGAGLLSIGIGASGALTYVYFALASHNLDRDAYGGIVVLWSALFITVVVLYRPVEQLLSRSLAESDTLGLPIREPLRVAVAIQLVLATAFVAVAIALRETVQQDLLSGSETLYWVFVLAAPAYAASFFARGFLGGRRRFGLYGAMLLLESASRLCFPLLVAVGIAEGQSVIALGILAAPLLSLMVVPLAARAARVGWSDESGAGDDSGPSAPGSGRRRQLGLSGGWGFAAAVFLIMLAEQTLLNLGPLIVGALADLAAAGLMFNILLVARAPQVLFQAATTTLLPSLTRSWTQRTAEGSEAFRLSVSATLAAVAGLVGLVTLAILIAGPGLMRLAFGDNYDYDRVGLLIIAAGMGFHLASLTLNQAALAQGQARRAAIRWAICAAAFVAWCFLPVFDVVRRVEIGFAGAAILLCALLYALYRAPRPRPGDRVVPDPTQPAATRLPADQPADEV